MSSTKNISRDHFKKLTFHEPDLIFQLTRKKDGSYCMPIASYGINKIFGCSPEAVKEDISDIIKVLHPQDSLRFIEQLTDSANNLSEFICEFRVCIPDKPIQWIFSKATPEKQMDGTITWFGFKTNVTIEKKHIDQIASLSKKQEAIIKLIPDLFIEVDIEGKIYDYHSNSLDLKEILPLKFIGKKIDEIIPKSATSILFLAINEADKKGYSIGYQYELQYENGFFWFEVSVISIVQKDEQKKKYIIVTKDITESYNSNDKLDQLSQVIDLGTSSIEITDLEGNIEFVNKKFEETSGYSQNELIGINPKILKSGYTKSETYKDLWRTIKSGKSWHGEFLNKKKDGKLFWEEVTISPIWNTKGEIKHFLGIKNDITKLKKNEEKFRKIAWNQSHQVRGPLTDILGILKLVKLDITVEEKAELLDHLEKAAEQLDQTIHDVIDETRKPI